MPKEKSAGAVVFYEEKGEEPLYLLLHYPSTKRAKKEYWDFAKGHVEGVETEEQTVRREVREETGISSIEFLKEFRETITYFFEAKGKRIFKTVVFYLAKSKTKDVTISLEHVAFVWLPFKAALDQLKFKNAKKVLTKAHQFFLRNTN